DLASGYQLAWQPVEAGTEEIVRIVLAELFARFGAPLVLKCDNGSPFRADGMKAFLEKAGVIPLYSPPYWPAYNGAVEAGIRALKRRTEQQAARHGRVGLWSWDDVEAARREANTSSRSQGWAGRTLVTDIERVRWKLAVQRHRLDARVEQGIGLEEELDHWQH